VTGWKGDRDMSGFYRGTAGGDAASTIGRNGTDGTYGTDETDEKQCALEHGCQLAGERLLARQQRVELLRADDLTQRELRGRYSACALPSTSIIDRSGSVTR
jgi:hypothetical protein